MVEGRALKRIREKAKKRVMLNGHHTALFANLKVLKA